MSHFNKKKFTMRQVVGLLTGVFWGASVIAYAVSIPNTFSSGATISSSQVNANFTAIKNAIDPLQVSHYFQFGSLNNGSIDVTTTWTKLNTTSTSHSFTKSRSDSKIEVHVNSRFRGGVFGGGASGVLFRAQIDGNSPTFGNNASIVNSNTSEFQSIYAVFEGVAAGAHTVSLWASAINGTSTGVSVDPGGWDGKIIVKESGI